MLVCHVAIVVRNHVRAPALVKPLAHGKSGVVLPTNAIVIMIVPVQRGHR
jgi:hypothetical protein